MRSIYRKFFLSTPAPYGFQYVRALARDFYGIQEICCVAAEGLDIAGADTAAILERAIQNIPAFRKE